jgi:hypothetical protein
VGQLAQALAAIGTGLDVRLDGGRLGAAQLAAAEPPQQLWLRMGIG